MRTSNLYMLSTGNGADDHIVARRLDAVQTMNAILAEEEGRSFHFSLDGYESFLRFEMHLDYIGGSAQSILQATVPKTDDRGADFALATAMIAEQFIRIAHQFSRTRITMEADWAEDVLREAEQKEADRTLKTLARLVIDRLIEAGYTFSRDVENDGVTRISFREETDAEFICDAACSGGLVEIRVHRDGLTGWLTADAGKEPADLFEYDRTLAPLIDPLIAPYKAGGEALYANVTRPSASFRKMTAC